MNLLSSREIAVALWTTVFAFWALSNRTVRRSAWKLLRQALFSRFVVVWISLATYASLLVLALRALGLWTSDLLKDTLIWFAFCALAYPFQFGDPQKQPRVLRVLLRDSLSVLIVVEVLVDTYTFSLPVELALVPVLTLIVLMGTVAETRGEHTSAARALSTLQALVGIVLIAVVIRRTVDDPTHSFLPALLSSLIVVILSIACWPYVYLLRLGFAHEGMLWRIGWQREVTRRFQHYAALRILRYLEFRPTAVGAFVRRNAFRLDEVVDRSSLERLLALDRSETTEKPNRSA